MPTVADILAARRNSQLDIPDRVETVVATTPGLTEAIYTRNVLDSLNGTNPWLSQSVEVPKTITDPTLNNLFEKLGIHDDAGAAQGKGRTALRKFIDEFPKRMKDSENEKGWKSIIEEDPEFGARGWQTVVDLWKAAVKDDAEEQAKQNMRDAVNDGTVAGFVTRSVLPRTTERIANTGDFEWKDVGLDALENGMMAVPGGMYVRAPVKAASLAGKGLAKAGLGGTRVSSVLANLPGHVTNASNAIAKIWGKTLPGTVALGVGKTAKNFAGNATVPFVMEGIDDAAYDEGEGMDERADYSVGDALTGAVTNQLVNRSLARMGQSIIPEAAGSIEVRSPAVMKMREILGTLGQSSHQTGDDFAAGVRAAASMPNRPVGTYTPAEISAMRSGSKIMDDVSTLITPEEAANADLSKTVLDAIDNGDIKILKKGWAKDVASRQKDMNRWSSKMHGISAARESASKMEEAGKLSDELKQLNQELVSIREAPMTPELLQRKKDIGRLMDAKKNAMDKLKNEALELRNQAMRRKNVSGGVSEYAKPDAYFDTGLLDSKLSYFDREGNFRQGIPYTRDEIDNELAKHIKEYVNYANWHGKPTQSPTKVQRILGLTDNPTAMERIVNDAKVALPTWGVNKAGRANMTKNLFHRIDVTDKIKEDQKETHEAPGQRVRKATAQKILSSGGNTLSADSKKYLAYLAEHPDAVKNGHDDINERSKFNMWLLTEGRDLLAGTPLHRPVWDIETRK